jgi:hypothetical protein
VEDNKMDRPKNHDALIDALYEGRATAEEAERLLGDISGPELDELAEIVDTLARIDPEPTTPSAARFRAARESVLATIADSESAGRHGRLLRWMPLAAALAAFAVGLAVGRGNATAPATTELTLLDLVDRGAMAASTGADSPFRFSGMHLTELDDGTLAMSVDVAAQLDLVRPKNDPLVNDILASSLIYDESLGTRLKAVRHLGVNPRMRSALTAAALGDPDMSVRLRALERLIEQDRSAAATQETLLAVIADEESVAMRLLALDAIEDDYLGTDLIETLDDRTLEDGGSAVLWQARQRLDRRSL